VEGFNPVLRIFLDQGILGLWFQFSPGGRGLLSKGCPIDIMYKVQSLFSKRNRLFLETQNKIIKNKIC